MATSAVLNEILKKFKITDYLESKGIHQKLTIGNKIKYTCPLHKETDPSFMVYLNGDGTETYYCFGCKSGGGYINLLSAFEKISIKEAILRSSEGIEITDQAELDFILNLIKKEIDKSKEYAKDDISRLLLNFAVLSYSILELTNFDEELINFMDKMYILVDDHAHKEEFTALEKMYNIILQEKLFTKKAKQIRKKQKEALRNKTIKNIANEIINE